MIVAGYDIETTGLKIGEDRIVEAYIGLWDVGSKSLIRQFTKRIDPQKAIAADAQRVHGISNADLIGCPIWDATIAGELREIMHMADFGVAHNGQEFDVPFTNAELERIKLDKIAIPFVDTMLQGRHATPIGKVPNLGELCFAYDVLYDTSKAHAADYDVGVMMECFFRGLEWGFFALPSPFNATVGKVLHAAA
jgi:DNA polymerase III subunit epsilon